jgi:predicted transcriptional regulator
MSFMAKISVSLDDELYERVRIAAGATGVSGWLADAALARFRAEALSEVASEIADATGGPYTDEELGEAREWLRLSSTAAR